MRRIIAGIVLLALGAFPTSARAQGIGLKVGGVFANVSNSGVLPNDMGSRTGFSAGIALGTRGGLIGFGAEALYVQNGLKSGTPGVRPFAYAGPQFSFELGCKLGGSDCPDATFGGGARKKTTFAGIVGAGLRLGGKAGLTIEARYAYGLTDLKYGTLTSSESYKDRDLMVLAGISF